MPDKKSIYQHMVDAKVQIDSHYASLYVPVNETTSLILKSYGQKRNVMTFIHEFDKSKWFDIPLAYEPYWDAKATKEEGS